MAEDDDTYDSGDIGLSVTIAENTLIVDTNTTTDPDLSDDNSTENLSFSHSGTDANSFAIDAKLDCCLSTQGPLPTLKSSSHIKLPSPSPTMRA